MMVEIEIIEMLCNGVDPRTGEIISTSNDKLTSEVRLSLGGLLVKLKKAERIANSGTPNAGKKWKKQDEQKLSLLWIDGEHRTLDSLVPIFGRTAGALHAKLDSLYGCKDRCVLAVENIRRGGKYGSDWSIFALDNV